MNRYIEENDGKSNPECLDITDVIKKQETDSASTISTDGDDDCVDSGTNNCEIDAVEVEPASSPSRFYGIDTSGTEVSVTSYQGRKDYCASDDIIVENVSEEDKTKYCKYQKCPAEPNHKADRLPKLIGPDKATVLHT